MRKRKSKHTIFPFSIGVCLIILSNIMSFNWYFENKKALTEQNRIKKLVNKRSIDEISVKETLVNPPQDKNDSYWNYTHTPFLRIDFTILKEQNSDTVGWLRVPGTNIDYVVVQASDNNYYLNHSFDHSNNTAGWIFSDFRNNLKNLNQNTIIYGHNRLDGSMFGSLKNVLDTSWYDNKENHIIKLSTPEESSIWQIFSVYEIDKESYYITTNFNLEKLQVFLNTIVERSIYNFNTTVTKADKILTLSTCKNSYGKRIVVHAKLLKKETY